MQLIFLDQIRRKLSFRIYVGKQWSDFLYYEQMNIYLQTNMYVCTREYTVYSKMLSINSERWKYVSSG